MELTAQSHHEVKRMPAKLTTIALFCFLLLVSSRAQAQEAGQQSMTVDSTSITAQYRQTIFQSLHSLNSQAVTKLDNSPANEQKPAPSLKGHFYTTVLVGTTLAFRPSGGKFSGAQKDITPMIGGGYYLTSRLAAEVDLGPTYDSAGNYVAFSFVPGIIYSLNNYLYVSSRFSIPSKPEASFSIFPGIGVTYPFKSGFAPYLEVNFLKTISSHSDTAVTLTFGTTYTF
jgi:hypothetical protein